MVAENFQYRAVIIPIDRIDLSKSYSISFPVNNEKLVDSIRRVGQLTPIIVATNGDKYNIVSGMRRFCAMKSLNINEIQGLLVDESDELKLSMIEIEEKISKRDLNIFEKANIINFLSVKFDMLGDDTRVKILKRLGFNESEDFVHKLKRTYKFSEDLKLKMLNNFTESHVLLLSELQSKKLLDMMVEITLKYHINYYLTTEILEYLSDLEQKRRMEQDLILEEILLKIKSLKLKAKEAGREIRRLLFNERYEKIVAEKERISNEYLKLKFPRNIDLAIPQKMGEDYFRIIINFISSRDLSEKVKILNEKSDQLTKIFSMP